MSEPTADIQTVPLQAEVAPTTAQPELPWPPPWARSVAFLTGIGLIVYEGVVDQSAHMILYGPAFALTGLPFARGIEKLLDFLSKFTKK
jgi:hypothetical protein